MNIIKLFCFPHLGGTAATYYQWKYSFPENIEICPIELAGRGERLQDPFYLNFKDMIVDIAGRVMSHDLDIYAFWGHSMGALIAYEVSYYLRNSGVISPAHIFFSGRNAPDLKDELFFECNDENKLMKKLNEIGGIPKEIFEYPDLFDMVWPVFLSDYKIMKSYGFKLHKQKLDSDISIISGTNDATINYALMSKWNSLTEKKCMFYSMQGGHFYIESNLENLKTLIETVLKEY